jgi:general stress protein 26
MRVKLLSGSEFEIDRLLWDRRGQGERDTTLGSVPRRMDKALRSKILGVLRRHHTMTLATIRPDGYPQATTVNYIHDEFTLYFASDAASQKAGNIKLNNKVSVAIASEEQNFYKLRGLSMSGIATRVADKGRAEELYLRLFRALPQSKRYVPEDPKQLAVYEITPVAIALVDYTSGFGKTYLVEL